MIRERLHELKEKTGYSWKMLSDQTGIPEPTIRKTFSGETVSPSYEVVTKLIEVMGGSLDETATPRDEKEGDDDMQTALAEIKAVYDARVQDLWDIINKISAEKRTLFYTMLGAIGALLAFIIYLFVDGMHGGWGFFRY